MQTEWGDEGLRSWPTVVCWRIEGKITADNNGAWIRVNIIKGQIIYEWGI